MTTEATTTPTTTTTSALPLDPGRWELDPGHSRIGFSVRHLGVSKVRGAFRSFAVDFVVGDTLAATSISATIEVESVDTGVADRDQHLLSDELLDVSVRPRLEFVSTEVRAGHDGRWTLLGDLTFGGVTNPVELDVEYGGAELFPLDGRVHAGFEARGRIRRKEYGLDFGYADAIVGDAITIELDLQFVGPQG